MIYTHTDEPNIILSVRRIGNEKNIKIVIAYWGFM